MAYNRWLSSDDLLHHQRKGAHWGIHNGPPYPLDRQKNKPKAVKRVTETTGTTKKITAASLIKAHQDDRFPSLTPDIIRALKPKRNEAIFFSGCREYDKRGNLVKKGAAVANDYARSHKGATMNTLLERNKVALPEWDFDVNESISKWEQASRAYASQASGNVRVIVGSHMRKGNIFETVELPTLKKNPNVDSITLINHDTGKTTVIFRRR